MNQTRICNSNSGLANLIFSAVLSIQLVPLDFNSPSINSHWSGGPNESHGAGTCLLGATLNLTLMEADHVEFWKMEAFLLGV